MGIKYFLVAGWVVVALACNNAGNPPQVKSTFPPEQQPGNNNLQPLIDNYYAMKDALIAANPLETKTAADRLATAAAQLQTAFLSDTTGQIGLAPYTDTILAQSKAIAASNDPKGERQRLPFGALSQAVYHLLQRYHYHGTPIYHTYCPMAYNGQGAWWLSPNQTIKNPYFGEKMLECGEITDTL